MNKTSATVIVALVLPFLILGFNVFVFSFADLVSGAMKGLPEKAKFIAGIILYVGPSVMLILYLKLPIWQKIAMSAAFAVVVYPIIMILAVLASCEFKGVCL